MLEHTRCQWCCRRHHRPSPLLLTRRPNLPEPTPPLPTNRDRAQSSRLGALTNIPVGLRAVAQCGWPLARSGRRENGRQCYFGLPPKSPRVVGFDVRGDLCFEKIDSYHHTLATERLTRIGTTCSSMKRIRPADGTRSCCDTLAPCPRASRCARHGRARDTHATHGARHRIIALPQPRGPLWTVVLAEPSVISLQLH